MYTYRIHFDDYTTKQYIETGEPARVREYHARNSADALRQWMNQYYGYTADRIERIEKLAPRKKTLTK